MDAYVALRPSSVDVSRQTSLTAAAAARVIATDGHDIAGDCWLQRRTNSSERIYWPPLSNHYSPPVTSASWHRRPKIASGQQTGRTKPSLQVQNCGVYYDITKRARQHHRVALGLSTCCRRRIDPNDPRQLSQQRWIKCSM